MGALLPSTENSRAQEFRENKARKLEGKSWSPAKLVIKNFCILTGTSGKCEHFTLTKSRCILKFHHGTPNSAKGDSDTSLITFAMSQPIIFVGGVHGAGKTTISRLLADTLGVAHVTAGTLIQEQYGAQKRRQ